MNQDIYKSDYDYEIPEKLIARYPPKNRTDSKLLLCKDQKFSIENFSSISNFFNKEDLIVFNETKVFKARLRLQKESGGQACLLYTSPSPRDKRQSRMPSSA